MHINIKIILIINLLTNIIFAQKPSIQFTHLNVEDGLSQSTVFSIIQDRDGFMWFGTEDGLNRYDGYNFHIFKTDLSDTNSLISNFVTALHQDKNGFIWI